MARAGDGNERSEERRLTATVSLRMTEEQKNRFSEAATKAGYRSLGALVLARLADRKIVGPQSLAILHGMLARHGGHLHDLLRDQQDQMGADACAKLEAMHADVLRILDLLPDAQEHLDARQENR